MNPSDASGGEHLNPDGRRQRERRGHRSRAIRARSDSGREVSRRNLADSIASQKTLEFGSFQSDGRSALHHGRDSGHRAGVLHGIHHCARGLGVFGTGQSLSENGAFERDNGLAVSERARDARDNANEWMHNWARQESAHCILNAFARAVVRRKKPAIKSKTRLESEPTPRSLTGVRLHFALVGRGDLS